MIYISTKIKKEALCDEHGVLLGLTQLICLAIGGPTDVRVMGEIPFDSGITTKVDIGG